MPTRGRNVSAVALRIPQRPELWLFDCGEGTQHQFLRSDLKLSQLRRIFLTHMHGDHVDEHVIEISEKNPDHCTPNYQCTGHDADHVHGPGCGHEAVPHGDHIDYLVDGRLHHPHNGHCDDHGPVEII